MVRSRRSPGLQKPAPGKVTEAAGAVGYVVPHHQNDAFIAVNRLLKANEEVFFVADRSYQSTDGTGVIFITAKPTTKAVLDKAAADLGLNFTAVTQRPAGATHKLTKPRIGLWDMYGGSMPSGWTRWLLEQYEFDFERVFPQTLDAGNLKAKFDVIIFPDGGIPGNRRRRWRLRRRRTPAERRTSFPRNIRGHLGRVTIDKTVPQLKKFAEAGGAIVAFGGSAVLGHHLGLPISDHLVEMTSTGAERALPRDKYYIPGSILQVAVDNTNPLAYGFEKQVDVMFDNSPVMHLGAERGDARRAAGGVVRRQGQRCAPAGRGASTISKTASPPRKRRSARARCSCSDRRSPSAPSRTARSSSCSTGSTTARRRRQERRRRPRRRASNRNSDEDGSRQASGPDGNSRRIRRIQSASMDLEQFFSLASLLAMIGWLLLDLLPATTARTARRRRRHSAHPVADVSLFSSRSHFRGAEGGFGSLADVATLFQKPELLLAGWIHYLAFDLFIGALGSRAMRSASGIPHLVVIPCLVMTFMLGPDRPAVLLRDSHGEDARRAARGWRMIGELRHRDPLLFWIGSLDAPDAASSSR